MIRTILGSRGGGSIPGHEVIKGKVENKHLGWISSSGSLHVLPVSNGGSELFLTYLRAQKELGAILAYLSVSARSLFFLKFLIGNFHFENIFFEIKNVDMRIDPAKVSI